LIYVPYVTLSCRKGEGRSSEKQRGTKVRGSVSFNSRRRARGDAHLEYDREVSDEEIEKSRSQRRISKERNETGSPRGPTETGWTHVFRKLT